MRNGFKSSRGAMRGTRGGVPNCRVGAVGFATVAIGVGPFVNSIFLRTLLSHWAQNLKPSALGNSPIRRKLFRFTSIRIAASDGAEVQKLAVFTQRDGQRLIHMHSTHGIPHQLARHARHLSFARHIRRCWRSARIAEHPGDETAQQPGAPGNNEHPDQKTYNASEKVHHSSVCQTARFALTPQAALRRVYARRKGPVKRKGVISTGCGTNCLLSFWANCGKIKLSLSNTTAYMAQGDTDARLEEKHKLTRKKGTRPLRRCRNPINAHVWA